MGRLKTLPEDLVKRIKRALIWVEVSGKEDHPNRYQLTEVVLRDIKKRFKDEFPEIAKWTWKDVLKDRQKQEKLANAYLRVIATEILPEDRWTVKDFVIAWYKPYLYKKVGFNVDLMPLKDRVIVKNRIKNYNDFLQRFEKRAR